MADDRDDQGSLHSLPRDVAGVLIVLDVDDEIDNRPVLLNPFDYPTEDEVRWD